MEAVRKFLEQNYSYVKYCLGIFVVLIVLSLHTKFTRYRAKQKIANKCKNFKSIFVVLLAHHNNASKVLFDLFENADCPSGLKVSVYDICDSNCIEKYKTMAIRFGKIGESFDKNITVLKRFPHDQGDYAAIYTLLKHNYQNEEYMCIMNDCIHMKQGWDTTLINNLLEKNNIITGVPDHFTVLDSFEDGIPKITMKKCARKGDFKMQFWTKQFSFSKSWNHYKTFHANKFLLGGTDILISSELIRNGYNFKNVSNVFNYVLLESAWKRDSKSIKASRDCIEFLKLPLDKLGIYPKLKPSCILGVVNENDKNEIEIKYGHIADYVYMRDLRFNV